LDEEYVEAGATIIDSAKEVWDQVDMMVKVKEPLPEEYPLFHEGLILYTYLHLAADKEQMDALLKNKIKAVAYETLTEKDGSLPLLTPMSQIAGRLSIQEGAKYLEKKFGGEGILLAGVPGTHKANVVILGGGTVGYNACRIAVGIGANVTILDIKEEKIDYLTDYEIELYINLSKFTSDTNYFIYVDIFRNQTYVLKKINNYFYLEKRLNCSTGELTTPTKRGTYKIVNKGKSFIGRSKDYICYNYLTYSGSYLLHSFPYSLDNKVLDDRVNDRVSNGCVRFSLLDSKYLYDVITIGTSICLY
jgi:hypothetical protein